VSQQPLPSPVVEVPREPRSFADIRASDRVQGFLFTLPALLVLGIFLAYPAYYTVRLAFYKGDFLYGFAGYLGLGNFKELLTNDPSFLDLSHWPPSGALINNLRWVIFYISLSLIFGLGLAVLAVRVRYERIVKRCSFRWRSPQLPSD